MAIVLLGMGCQPGGVTAPAISSGTSGATRDTLDGRNTRQQAEDQDTDGQEGNVAADPAPVIDSGDAVEIAFEDIQLPIQADVVFRPFMLTERVKELDGKRIRINGYMLPDSRTKGITQFVLLKNTECKFGPGGQADHLLNVLMVDGVTAKYRDDPITVEGILTVKPFQGPDGNTWSIYDLACERVARYRPRR